MATTTATESARHFESGRCPNGPWSWLAGCHKDGLLPGIADQMVANDYQPGSGIFAHVDQAVFGDAVASLRLARPA